MVKKILMAVFILGGILISSSPSDAAVISEYKINSAETVVDTANTSAVVDTVAHEIRLPALAGGRRLSFEGEDYDYIALANGKVSHFSYDGSKMVENTVASVNGLSNPLAIFSSDPYPDVVVATSTDVKHYSFSGTGMVENPALSVTGLTSVASVTSRGNDVAFLQNSKFKYYAANGTNMSQIPNLSISSGLNNPVEAALFPNTYNVAVMEPDKVRFYCFTGNTLTESPDMAITGFTNPLKSISTLDGTVSVIEGSQVKTYLYNGTNYSYVQALSVTDSLTAPTCVALRPGSRDMIIADGDEIKYYMYDGTKLVYNANLSKQVTGLSASAGYVSDASVQSNAISHTATATRITAYCSVPSGTSITWSNYTSSWIPIWRVRGLTSSTVLEYSPDSGTTWTIIGTVNTPIPGSNVAELWNLHSSVSSVKWKAVLHTDNSNVSPKIVAPNPGVDTAIRLETNIKPDITINCESCFLTMTPTINWTFTDADGDSQVAYNLQILNSSTGDILYSYSANSSVSSHKMLPSEDPAVPSQLWSSGLNTFFLEIRANDGIQWSSWVLKVISFRAFERPRIAELSVPANGYTSPILITPSTHRVIKQGMTSADLPITKAGGQVTMYIDSIGMVDLAPPTTGSLSFPYLSQTATIKEVSIDTTIAGSGQNKRWKIRFWTDPNKTICPDNTVVKMLLTGSSGGYAPEFNCPSFADGVIKTKGSVMDNWFVVLQGSNQ